MKRLEGLLAQGSLAPIDYELGMLLQRRAAAALPDAEDARLVGVTAALLSAERGRGHSCIDLAEHAGVAPWASVADVRLPDAASWRGVLQRSRLCGDGGALSPLVLDGDRLYLYRYHAAERRLADAVHARLHAPDEAVAVPGADTTALFGALFPAASGGETDWQAVAATTALRSRLTVITGGPGTGKTTTIARILALLLHREPTLRVALAAPTGKAAARLAEAVVANTASLPIEAAARAALPRDGRTLHRLLGYQPWNDAFAHGPDAPLAEDVIVVDEASMVDVLMMDALFAAARPSARIILLGDQDQLASVDTGYVLGDVCRAASASPPASPLREAVVRLRTSYRFAAQPGIGALAEAIRAGDAAAACATLDDARFDDVARREPARSIDALLAPVAPLLDAYLDARDPAEALARFGAFRLLCALREGRAGVAGLNDAIEHWLRGRGVFTRARWYDARPVLVTANDVSTGLFNGDVGVTWTEHGRTQVFVADGAGGVRGIAPARLPAHETAWAMTVHKSQGSEFDRVLLVLPDEDARVLTRELLYTAVTRARRSVDVVGSEAIVRGAVARVTARASGLAGRLVG